MPKINFEKIIKAERKKVFETISNYEQFQNTLPKRFPSIRVLSVRDNVAVVEQHIRISGKELVMMTKHITQYPQLHEVFVIGGDAKGSHFIEKYESVSEGTKVTVDADIKLKGALRLAGFFAKSKIQKDLEMIIDEFSKIVET